MAVARASLSHDHCANSSWDLHTIVAIHNDTAAVAVRSTLPPPVCVCVRVRAPRLPAHSACFLVMAIYPCTGRGREHSAGCFIAAKNFPLPLAGTDSPTGPWLQTRLRRTQPASTSWWSAAAPGVWPALGGRRSSARRPPWSRVTNSEVPAWVRIQTTPLSLQNTLSFQLVAGSLRTEGASL